MVKKLRMDWFLFAIAAALALFGSIMVYSASAMISLRETDSATQFSYFNKQFVFTVIGLAVMYGASKIDYHWYNNRYIVYGFLGGTVFLLLAVFGFPAINGARRWIRLMGMSFQPSELAKVALPMFLAFYLTENKNSIGDLKGTVLPCFGVVALVAGLIFLEPDLGTVIVLSAIFAATFFASGANLLHLGVLVFTLLFFGSLALVLAPWRMQRLIAFLEPCSEENKIGAGYQVCQSLMGIGSGGIFGEGFARGQQKLFYLPYPHSDFIFATVGEELGMIGSLAVVVAFGLLLWRGTRAALLAPDRFGNLLGIGIITGIIVQALFNISVVISIVPAKGIPLPFISYGGSSIIVTLFAVGVLLSISQHAGFISFDEKKGKSRSKRKKKKRPTRARKVEKRTSA